VSREETLLHRLLPSYLWFEDERHGQALRALVDALAEQHAILRDDVERLYRDLFVETCRPRIVPLIGENVGVVGPGAEDRAWVGQVVGLRRHKGTRAALARGARAAGGWGVLVEDAAASLGRTQSLLAPDPRAGALLSLADGDAVAAVAEPWSRATRLACVSGRPVVAGVPAPPGAPARTRPPAPGTATLGVWRLMGFHVTGRTPHPAADAPRELAGRAFRFDPLGRDTPLFTAPGDDAAAERPSHPLGRAELSALLRHEPPRGARALAIRVAGEDGRPRSIPGRRIAVADLTRWALPAGARTAAEAIVDPICGRLVLRRAPRHPAGRRHELGAVEVDYAYGFPGELGGGPYATEPGARAEQPATVFRVARSGPDAHRSLADALAAWRRKRPTSAVISIEHSASEAPEDGVWRVALEDGMRLEIAGGARVAPVLDGELHAEVRAGAELHLRGLTVAGAVSAHGDGALTLEHTTVAPHGRRRRVLAGGGLALSARRCVLGGIDASAAAQVALRACIVDGAIGDGEEPAGTLDAAQTTVLGEVAARVLVAEDCIFCAPVDSADPGRGVIRTSYLPARSAPPRLISCVNERDGRPRFTSRRRGAPGYCQLALGGPRAIATGAAHGGELGAFNWLAQPARFARLSAALQELLPAGMGAAIEIHT